MKKNNIERADYHFTEELGGIERLDASYHKQNFSRHSHEGYTVGVIEEGAQRFFRTGNNHIAPQHSIILINADEVHSGQSATENGWSYRAMYPVPALFESISRELGLNHGAPYFPEAVVYDEHMANMLRLGFTTLNTSDNRLLRETLIYSMLIKLVARHSKARPDNRLNVAATPQMLLVKQFLDDQPQVDVSLVELANLVNLSPCYLLRQFQRHFGLPPHTYQIQLRLRLAKQLISQGSSLLDVALECGFHDQSHFSRHFKKTLGVTPGNFAKAIGNIIQ
ncbi:helix-turn-helix transcriptional regulator [Shewanella surugensis]|uniref:AraC family transcriptional regulator n=1 Tax=Shewanella surugensis TaxID=212020 RepID=A0ABT0LCZ3_9GAMM|nr:AraC family transcriptional regulator [Shewanella surugensis]MCL1125581.1 AraC family transcriptional regulator [Shewanella surugensis]